MFATVLTGPDEGPATLCRFTLDLATGRAHERGVDQRSQEFPRHDERLTGRRHRYGWAVGFEGGALGDTVLRHDLEAGTTDVAQPRRRARRRASSASSPTPTAPTRATGCCWATSSTAPRAAASCGCWTR